MEFQERKPGDQPATQEFRYSPEGQAPSYTYSAPHAREETAWYNPKTWSRKVLIAVIVVAIIILVIVIAVPVAVTQSNNNNSYPDYAEVAYSLAETCKQQTSHLYRMGNGP